MSGLRERLLRARGEPSAAPGDAAEVVPGQAAPPQPSLADRVRRLAAAREGSGSANGSADARTTAALREPTGPAAPDDTALAAQLCAERLAPGVLRRSKRLPLALMHGGWSLHPDPAAVRRLLPDASPDTAGWVALDTETSGLAGGTGTWVFVVGLARWWASELEITQFLLTRLDAERAFLEQVLGALAGAELLLSYNGKSFDLPLLAARLRLARLQDPMTGVVHLDLLHPVRRAFAGRWPDCRLATVEQRLLERSRGQDLPGAEAPAAWLDWLRRGDGRRLDAVLAHNRVDLLSVAALPAALGAVHRAPVRFNADPLRIARWRLAADDAEGARALLSGAGASALNVAGRRLLARLHTRAGDWLAALALWEQLAEAGDAASREALAKHFEHRVGDLQRALAHAQCLPPGALAARRRARLLAKLARRDSARKRAIDDFQCDQSKK